ncbi:MAG TPA: hypothetical protein VJA47_06540 [archaeon]|nr:hypothetical protein [archaeon]
MKRYLDLVWSSSFWLGLGEGYTDAVEKPTYVCRILHEKSSFDKLMGEFQDLGNYADEHYLESPYHIDSLENFSSGYRTGSYCGFASIGLTFGLSHLVAKAACRQTVKSANRHVFIGDGPKEKV